MKLITLPIGTKIHRLTVTSDPIRKTSGFIARERIYYDCVCDCGNSITVLSDNLRRESHTQSCGCLQKEAISKAVATHNQSRTPLYYIWYNMKNRCLRPSTKGFKYYGGKGIKLCPDWLNFEPFLLWSLKSGYRPGLSIDRINSSGDYEPANCRWATKIQQMRNKSNNIHATAFGETKLLVEWSSDPRCGIKRSTLAARLDRGWSEERAISEKLH